MIKNIGINHMTFYIKIICFVLFYEITFFLAGILPLAILTFLAIWTVQCGLAPIHAVILVPILLWLLFIALAGYLTVCYVETRFEMWKCIKGVPSLCEKFIFWACLIGSRYVVRQCLAAGANVNQVDQRGNTPLHCAFSRGYDQVANLLIEVDDINVNQANKDGDTPVHYAFRYGFFNNICHYRFDHTISRLYDKNVDFRKKNKQGETPLEMAKEQPKILKKIRNRESARKKETTGVLRRHLPENLRCIILGYAPQLGQQQPSVSEDEEIRARYPT